MRADDELERVLDWRCEQALAMGVPYDDALDFASGDGDLNLLRDLIGAGCDPLTAARIVG